MTCTTCHNPHSTPRGEQAAEHYTAVCRNCHASAHASKMPAGANSCVECHMPKRRPEDVVHAVMTDHYIQRRPPSGDLLKPIQEAGFVAQDNYRGQVTLYYPPQLPRTPENELYQDVAQVYNGANLKSGIPRLQQDLEKYKPERPEFYVALGDAYVKTNNYDQAIHWYDEALRRRGDFRPALEELGGALIAAGRFERAVEVLEKAAATPLPNLSALSDLGGVYFMQGNLDRAAQVLQRALALNPDIPKAHNSMGLVSIQQNDWSGAEQYFREAVSIQPDFAEPHYNLANVLARASQFAEAQYHFEKAIASRPEYTDAHRNYGLLLLRMGSEAKALIELQETVRLDPNSYYVHLVMGQILAHKGDMVAAREHYEKAAQSPDPAVRDAARKVLH
jgi:predicted CXXCH cytochrome family protein